MSTSPSKPRPPRGETNDPLRPADHIDADPNAVTSPALGVVGWLRWAWRLLTSMRTALVLLLVLAIAAIPGSIFPQRSADPNGVVQWQTDNPDLFPVLDGIQLFDVYTSVWFSAIYLLLFISLVGCIIPRIKHHAKALRSRPPRTPARLARLEDHRIDEFEVPGDAATQAEHAVDVAAGQLRGAGYRVERYDGRGSFSVSAERGYARETGNLLFHISLVGVLVSVGLGGGLSYTGQTVIVEGSTFVNQLVDYTQMTKGQFVNESALSPYAMTLDSFDVKYQPYDPTGPASGQAGDFAANMTIRASDGQKSEQSIRVNHPLSLGGDRVYLLGNGYAPQITVRNAAGEVVFSGKVPFLPQNNATMTSLGVVKVTDGMPEQLGLLGFFYPTAAKLETGALTSVYPALIAPTLTFNVYEGDLGINDGSPKNVYTLDTSSMKQLNGGDTGVKAIELTPGGTAQLPNGLGSVTFENADPNKTPSPLANQSTDFSKSVPRYVSIQMRHDPTAIFVLSFAILALGGLLLALFIPRRRLWVRATPKDGRVVLEYAGLARGEDPQLGAAVTAFADKHQSTLSAADSKVD
ncbi:cytochrome c biogenesis protein ResB [Microbacterium gorillae]|uniref:cytochrome c biogenesis protein ResB n=1 Tax=Microbacterium gorillae TaxID=1231063 RepID=UPI000694203D|nr:cytochrome c biogenesis protein ResB [Microbacterium gorillae]